MGVTSSQSRDAGRNIPESHIGSVGVPPEREGDQPRHPLLLRSKWHTLHNHFHDDGYDTDDVHHHHGPGDYDLILCSKQHDDDWATILFVGPSITVKYGPADHTHP